MEGLTVSKSDWYVCTMASLSHNSRCVALISFIRPSVHLFFQLQIMPFFSFSLFPCCKPGTESTKTSNASDLLITPGSSNSELKAALDAMKDEMKAEMNAMKDEMKAEMDAKLNVALAAIDSKFEAAGITSSPLPAVTELPVDQRMDNAAFSPLSDDDAPIAALPPSGQFEASSLGSPDSSSFWHQASSVDQTLDFADRQRRYDLPTNMPKYDQQNTK